MRRQVLAFVMLYLGFAVGTAYAQECLHGPKESDEQAARRRGALTATRNINNIEANQPGRTRGLYLSLEELDASPYAFKMRESTGE